MPKVTVLMPLFNGIDFIEESLQSIQAQTFTDWEFIIVNDFGSDDGCADVIRKYAETDPRIILIQAEERLGLAASLNYGLEFAKGEYVARVDADDPSYPNRLERQVAFMDAHPEVTVAGCLQRSVTTNRSYVQEVVCDPEELKAAMMFGCEISHCGVMFRLADMNAHDWRYNPSFLGEDYELWTRMMSEGATILNIPEVLVDHRWGFGNISIGKGNKLKREVCHLSQRMIGFIGLDASDYLPELFSGWRNKPTSYAKSNRLEWLTQGASLLTAIAEANDASGFVAPEAMRKVLFQRWNWIRECCGMSPLPFTLDMLKDSLENPKISVVLPAFNSALVISNSIDSIIIQTMQDWEMLIVNEYESNDGTADLVRLYAYFDKRIHLLQVENGRLGLAESLNLGIRKAHGKYIARLDADDTSVSTRFEKQYIYLESHPNVGICGAWQHHNGNNVNWTHEAAVTPDACKARLLFGCDLCHSTLMLRRSAFVENNLFYNPDAYAEDFELWTRAMNHMDIANIPEVLGKYTESENSITFHKMEKLHQESGQIVAATLKQLWNLELSAEDAALFENWRNDYMDAPDREARLSRLESVLRQIWECNQKNPVIEKKELLQSLAAKWHWAKEDKSWNASGYHVFGIDDVFSEEPNRSLAARYRAFLMDNPGTANRAKKIIKKGTKVILRPIAFLLRKITWHLMKDVTTYLDSQIERWTWERYKRTNKDIERWTWERYKRTNKDIERWTWSRYLRAKEDNQKLLESTHNQLDAEMIRLRQSVGSAQQMIPYLPGAKIRVLFLFQIASFWPSWESLYHACMADNRLDVTFTLFESDMEVSQMKTAREFLDNKGIPYVIYSDELLLSMQPHIVVMETPYDIWHRPVNIHSRTLRDFGCRVVYIPYGIEISDTLDSHQAHFLTAPKNCWRVYTFNEQMRRDYMRYCPNRDVARSFGHPKFDMIYSHKKNLQVPEIVREKAKGRKIVLWHVHFPKKFPGPDGKWLLVTPYLEEYVAFTKYVKANPDLFFVFLPHPKFLDCQGDLQDLALDIIYNLSALENTYIAWEDEYTDFLLSSDYIISDRSALMIEASAVDVPILYMSNIDYEEPMTAAITPLMNSYEHGHTAEDMVAFVERCKLGEDLRREERRTAFDQCIPYFDGRSGERIKEDMINSIIQETVTPNIEDRLDRLEAMIRELAERR